MWNSILVLQQVNSNLIQHSLTATLRTGNSRKLLRTNSADLTDAITTNLYRVTDALYAKGLIPQATVEEILVMGVVPDHTKALKLMLVVQQQLESSSNPDQYLIDTCHVLINQQHQRLTDIATYLLQQLGKCTCDNNHDL